MRLSASARLSGGTPLAAAPRRAALGVFSLTRPSGTHAYTTFLAARFGDALSPGRPTLPFRLVLDVGLLFLFGRQLAWGQASLLERFHLLQQGFLQVLRHSLPFRTTCAIAPARALIIPALQFSL
jgi:hypothetical protein